MTLSSSPRRSPRAGDRPDPRVLRCVRQATLAGIALVLVWPAARGHSAWLGWLPLWLLGMPAMAWWAVLRFPFPAAALLRRQAARRRGPQARRRRRPVTRALRPDLRHGSRRQPV